MIRAIPGRTCTSTEEPVLPADRHVCRQFDRQLPGGLGRLLLAPHEAGMARAEHRCEGDGPHLASSLDAPRLRPRVEDRRYAPSENVDGVHARTTTAAGATGPSIRVVSRDVSGDAYLVELWVDGTRR